jgi:DNA polymerase
MAKQEPFYGGSGKHLDRAFARAQIDKIDLYITNVVHCHPPNNRASLPQEVANCAPYLSAELDIVRPRLAIGLGDDAKAALRENYPTSPQLDWPLLTIDGLEPGVPGRPVLLFPRHPGSFRWIRKELRDDMTEQWVDCLARALRWASGLEGN